MKTSQTPKGTSSPAAPRTVAVILAGGIGTRVGLGIPKQLLRIAGKPIVEHTLEILNDSPLIDEVIVMMNSESIGELEHLVESPRFHKLHRVLPGGETRNATTLLAINALAGEECKVLFHDAVRPFVDDRIIADCIAALDQYQAVDTAIASADTIIEVDDHDSISGIPDRSFLRRGQTPQGFWLSTIRAAYELAALDPDFRATDDCGVVFKYLPDVPIHVVPGTPENMKVTDPIDVHIADKIFQLRSPELNSTNAGENAAALQGKNIVIFGGSYGIGLSLVEASEELGARVASFSRSTTSTDVRSRSDIASALTQAAAELGGVDAVVVTAGVLRVAELTDSSDDELRSTLETNLLGPMMIAQEAFPYLKESAGQLLFFTSSSYTRGRAGYSIYSATKAGIVNLTQALSEEWESDEVRVNCINPQRTRTPMREAAFGAEPIDTLLDPLEVAQASIDVLASSLTGQVVAVAVKRSAN